MSHSDEQTILMMPAVTHKEDDDDGYGPSSGTVTAEQVPVPVSPSAIADFASQYTGYELDTIEVHIKGAAKTGKVTQLFVGLSGEAGVKLVLKKKKADTSES
ncbi:hypothetical protein C1N66_20965 [Bacillus cereus]|uniref:Uncharacterized protein n=1 Tax=Bacillus cereus TaxID=1396 RepID=A0AB73UNM5_BACCE|nr:hypothetical protein [Bacillus cereus]QHV05551.1 hypothetical protein C1N82_20875 [Bacillus cereus]QHV45482.1 hypothetical protein C1N66_20965 [Bacillus cereus]